MSDPTTDPCVYLSACSVNPGCNGDDFMAGTTNQGCAGVAQQAVCLKPGCKDPKSCYYQSECSTQPSCQGNDVMLHGSSRPCSTEHPEIYATVWCKKKDSRCMY